jgi:hypothetical protein
MCFVIVLVDGFDTAPIGLIAPSLITEWNISKPELASVLSANIVRRVRGRPWPVRFPTALQYSVNGITFRFNGILSVWCAEPYIFTTEFIQKHEFLRRRLATF